MRQKGFTLLETLVALGILAIAMAAVLRAAGSATNNAMDLRNRLLADWIAQDRLVLHQATGSWQDLGVQQGEVSQANVRFILREEISETPNPAFRRIEISVFLPENEQHAIRKMTGFLVRQKR